MPKTKTEPDKAEFISPTQFAQRLNVDRSTALRWIKEKRIRAAKIGERWVIPLAEIARIHGDAEKNVDAA